MHSKKLAIGFWELSLAKLVGVVLLLAPVPARIKEWAYAGFAHAAARVRFAVR